LKNISNTFYLLFILILFPLSLLGAQSGIDYSFEQGNQSYRSGEYQSAIDSYQKIIEAGYESGRLYYNLGNCYYKLDKIGYAILYYEKSKRFLPNDPEVNFNLELARLKVIDRIEMPPQFFLFEWWEKIKYFYSIPQLTKITIIFYVLTATIFIIFLFLKNNRIHRFFSSIFLVFLLFTIFFGYILFANIHEEKSNQYAILLSPTVNVLSAPEENSTDVFILHEGVKVKLEDEREDWLKIMLTDGKSGWIKRNHIGII
jgi:tetratricopeptide (TPR) repeat protein